MNSFGTLFRLSIFGESHNTALGILIDGCPPGIAISEANFEADLLRRKPLKEGTTARKESDRAILKSGVYKGKTTGAPLLIEFANENIRSKDYAKLAASPRPGHADYVALQKYKKHNDLRGGGHFSGRLTLGLVAAGVLAKKILPNLGIESKILEIGGEKDYSKKIRQVQLKGDSLGGVVECRVARMPISLGEPFFDSLESKIAHLSFSIPGVKGIEFGSGFAGSKMQGSEFNDCIIDSKGTTKSNHSGGVNGGISNGNDLVFRLAIRPTASIAKAQQTFNFESKSIETLKIAGRHDSCFALRVPVIAEAITAIALADLFLMNKTY